MAKNITSYTDNYGPKALRMPNMKLNGITKVLCLNNYLQLDLTLIKAVYLTPQRKVTPVAYDANMINNYDHLQDTARPSHMGSKNSEPHLAGGDAGYSVAMGGKGNSYGAKEQDPGGSTPGKVGKSKKGSMMDSQHGKERGAPGGMEM